MRAIALATACLLAVAIAAPASAMPASPAPQDHTAFTLAKDSDKGEPLTKKIKRAWKNLVGYKFDVACLGGHTSCSETGDSRGDARNKCISRHPLCWVNDTD